MVRVRALKQCFDGVARRVAGEVFDLARGMKPTEWMESVPKGTPLGRPSQPRQIDEPVTLSELTQRQSADISLPGE